MILKFKNGVVINTAQDKVEYEVSEDFQFIIHNDMVYVNDNDEQYEFPKVEFWNHFYNSLDLGNGGCYSFCNRKTENYYVVVSDKVSLNQIE